MVVDLQLLRADIVAGYDHILARAERRRRKYPLVAVVRAVAPPALLDKRISFQIYRRVRAVVYLDKVGVVADTRMIVLELVYHQPPLGLHITAVLLEHRFELRLAARDHEFSAKDAVDFFKLDRLSVDCQRFQLPAVGGSDRHRHLQPDEIRKLSLTVDIQRVHTDSALSVDPDRKVRPDRVVLVGELLLDDVVPPRKEAHRSREVILPRLVRAARNPVGLREIAHLSERARRDLAERRAHILGLHRVRDKVAHEAEHTVSEIGVAEQTLEYRVQPQTAVVAVQPREYVRLDRVAVAGGEVKVL